MDMTPTHDFGALAEKLESAPEYAGLVMPFMDKIIAALRAAEEQEKRLRELEEALRFYADGESWRQRNRFEEVPAGADRGKIARLALGWLATPTPENET